MAVTRLEGRKVLKVGTRRCTRFEVIEASRMES